MEHSQLVKQYFDRHARSWHDYYTPAPSLLNVMLIDRKNLGVGAIAGEVQPPARILDAGCGAGLAGVDLARLGFQVEGWDVAPEMIGLASDSFRKASIAESQYRLEVGDLLESDLPKASFDGVLALGFLQYQPAERTALSRLRSLLRPGGALVVSGPVRRKLSNGFGLLDPNRKQKSSAEIRKPGGALSDTKLLHTISPNSYSLSKFKRLLKEADLEFTAFHGHGYANFPLISRRLSFKRQLLLHRALTKMARGLPISRFANDIVVVARRPGA